MVAGVTGSAAGSSCDQDVRTANTCLQSNTCLKIGVGRGSEGKGALVGVTAQTAVQLCFSGGSWGPSCQMSQLPREAGNCHRNPPDEIWQQVGRPGGAVG